MKIAVVGTGYVGLVTGSCFAETGNEVICIDLDQDKIGKLRRGEIPFHEPGLPELVNRNCREARLSFSEKLSEPLSAAEVAFVCVGTPSGPSGEADLAAVYSATEAAAKALPNGAVLAIKSTVPVGTADEVRRRLAEMNRADLRVVSNPEFLREGSAVQDCLMPDRVVVGRKQEESDEIFRGLYEPYLRTGKPIFFMDSRSAEMTKYAANALLACRISFINEIARLCVRVNADIMEVRKAIGTDHRIGLEYLFPSVGFGGSCFPKDVRALLALAESSGMESGIFRSILEVNDAQKEGFVQQMIQHFERTGGLRGKKIAVWGLSFKAKTDDLRESPALTVIDRLLDQGARITVYDPVAHANARMLYGDKLEYASSAYDALADSDALAILTEWNQFRHPDFTRIKELLSHPTIFDGRNLYDASHLERLGFQYYSIGRAPVGVKNRKI